MKKKPQKNENQSLALHLKLRLREGLLIVTCAIALFITLSLITFHGSDWSHEALSNHIDNLGGRAGAIVSWSFLAAFGYMAYSFPLMLGYSGWLYLRSLIDPKDGEDGGNFKSFLLRSIAFVAILVSGCGLLAFQFTNVHSAAPMGSGGWLGDAASESLILVFNNGGAILILLAVFCTGLTLFTGISWLVVIDTIGRYFLRLLTKFSEGLFQSLHKLSFYFKTRKAEKIRQRELKRKAIDTRELKVDIKKAAAQKQSSSSSKASSNTLTAIKPSPIVLSTRAQKERQTSLFPEDIEGELPSLNLLDQPKHVQAKGYSHQQLESMSREVEARLKDFGIEVQVVAVHPGPVITRFEIQLAPGVKVSRISSLAKDLARSLSVTSVRIVEVIPGKPVVGLELPNDDREIVYLSEILSSQQYEQARSSLALALGKDIAGEPVIADLAKMPHLLVAGTTGSGKSVGVNAMLMGLLYKLKPDDVRMILVDPKMLELSIYEGIPHLLTPVVTDMKEAANVLRWSVAEMERRYRLMSELGVRNLAGFNKKIKDAMKAEEPIVDPLWKNTDGEPAPPLAALPYIVIVIDEYADMMMVVGKKVEQLIARIAQKARAAGIHLILATQRPSVDVITGLIKANVPSRIAFQVSSKIDSRTVLDQAGAEQLLGQGDMLYLPSGTSMPIRVHGALVSDEEVHRVVSDWKKRGKPEYNIGILSGDASELGELGDTTESAMDERDPLYDEAVFIVTKSRKASVSNIQRRLKIGYNRASRLVELMEEQGIVSSMESNGSREVLAPPPVEVM